MNAIIYDWGTRPDFLLRRLYPHARMVVATPLVDADLSVPRAQANSSGASLYFFHLNLSNTVKWFPDRAKVTARLSSLGYRVVNGNLVDVRKSTVQALNRELGLPSVMLGDSNDYHIKVMVKTDYNYGGVSESRLSPAEINSLGLVALEGCPVRDFDQYYVCRLGEVEAAVWRDKRLVVEQYIDNPDNRFYRFYRCGSRAVLSEIINKDIVKKMVPGLPRKNWFYVYSEAKLCLHKHSPGLHKHSPGHPPESFHNRMADNAATMCESLQLEFGAMDIVVDQENRPYIIDINPTPGWGAEQQSEMLTFLCGGFEGILQ